MRPTDLSGSEYADAVERSFPVSTGQGAEENPPYDDP